MKVSLLVIPFALVVCLSSVKAADNKMDMKKPDAPATPAAPAAPKGTEGSWEGTIGASQGQGQAVLHIKPEKDKKSDLKELVLWADTASLKSEIEDAIKKHATVKVSGTLAPNNSDVKVTTISIEEKKKKGKTK